MSQHEVKEHLKRNKNVYISIGCSVLIAGITGAMMRNSIAQRGMCEDVAQRGTVNTASHFSFGNRQIVTISVALSSSERR